MFSACIVNGVRFHTKDRESRRNFQNSGLVIEGEHNNKPTDFYGVVSDIIEIRFMKGCRTILLSCQWFDTENKKIEYITMAISQVLTSVKLGTIMNPSFWQIKLHKCFT